MLRSVRALVIDSPGVIRLAHVPKPATAGEHAFDAARRGLKVFALEGGS
jgi:hypothetical protein